MRKKNTYYVVYNFTAINNYNLKLTSIVLPIAISIFEGDDFK